jgi:hypothetical protein
MALGREWRRYTTLVDAWMARYRCELIPALKTWEETGSRQSLALARAVAERLQQDRASIDAVTSSLRRQAAFVPPLKAALHPAFEQMDLCARTEDVEITPAVLAGSGETSEPDAASISGRYRTADDVARSLRQSLPSEPERIEPAPGLWSRLRSLLGGS